jgi:hypothetical protein
MSAGVALRPARKDAGSADGKTSKMTNVRKLTTSRSRIAQNTRLTMYAPTRFSRSYSPSSSPYFTDMNDTSGSPPFQSSDACVTFVE